MRVPTWLYFLVFVGLLIGNVKIYGEIFAPPTLTVSVLKTGKDSAILVESSNGKRFLINAGRDASILRDLGAALPFWQRRLDGIILTSSAAGYADGLPDVLARYRVPTVTRSPGEGSYTQESNIERATENIPVIVGWRGDRVALGGGAYADILWPPRTPAPMNLDMGELVIRLSYGSTSVLIAHDPPPRVLSWLSATDTNLPPPDLTISSTTLVGTYIFD